VDKADGVTSKFRRIGHTENTGKLSQQGSGRCHLYIAVPVETRITRDPVKSAVRRWTQSKHVRSVVGTGRFQRHVGELLGYLKRNEDVLVRYAARRRHGEPISTASIERAVNKIVAKCMNKKQHMRWNRATVQPSLACAPPFE
jgi:hypothetical protein